MKMNFNKIFGTAFMVVIVIVSLTMSVMIYAGIGYALCLLLSVEFSWIYVVYFFLTISVLQIALFFTMYVNHKDTING